jgi:hypothetical protein
VAEWELALLCPMLPATSECVDERFPCPAEKKAIFPVHDFRLGPCQVSFPLTSRVPNTRLQPGSCPSLGRMPSLLLFSAPPFLSSYHVQPPFHSSAVHPAAPSPPVALVRASSLSSLCLSRATFFHQPAVTPFFLSCWIPGPGLILTFPTGSAELSLVGLAPFYLHRFPALGFTCYPD